MKLFYHACIRVVGLMVLGSVFFLGEAYSQRTISGTVTDPEFNEPLIGATVMEKENQTNGVVTDFDGNFELTVSDQATAVIVRYTGYGAQEVPLGASNVLNISMENASVLTEFVKIGYGTVKREDATGLVQTVDASQFNRGAVTGAQELIAGKIPGVAITTDPSPGGGAKIRIRGESSLSASNDPLIVLDGVPLNNGGPGGGRNALNFINPNDIESVTVLKDASAAAIYGNRAAGGVLLITTKKASQGGKAYNIGYNANVSVSQTYNRLDVLSADEFRNALTDYYRNDSTGIREKALPLLGNASTDWQDEIYQNAIGTDHNLSLSMNNAVLPYRISLGYTNKDGVLKTDNFERLTYAYTLTPQFFDNTLQFQLNLKGMTTQNQFADRGAIGNAARFDPTQPIRYDTATLYEGYSTWVVNANNLSPNGLAPTNPVALLELRDDNSEVRRHLFNINADYRFPFLPALRANLTVGRDYSEGKGRVFVPNTVSFAFDAINGGGVNNRYESTNLNDVWESYLNFKDDFGSLGLDAMVGYSWQHFKFTNSSLNSDVAGSAAKTVPFADASEYYLVSLYSRVQASLYDRFLLTGTLRRDATSRFAKEFRVGYFPSAALAVKVLNKDRTTFDNLKLRLGWGITGQQDVGGLYQYLPQYQAGTAGTGYQLGNTFYELLRANAYVGNARWEETTTTNLGLDFSIVRNRIWGSLDFYERFTEDLFVFSPLAALENLSNFSDKNVGDLRNRGVELALNFTPINQKRLQWDVNVNAAFNRGKIEQLILTNDPDYLGVQVGGIAGGVGSNIQIHSVGYQPSMFYVYQQAYGPNGQLLPGEYVDVNGDDVVDEDDFIRYKSPNPDFIFGLTNNLNVGPFSLAFAGRALLNNYVYNNVQTDAGYLDRMYHPSNYLSNINRSAVDLNVQRQEDLTFSNHFVKKASFFRLDHITLGYQFPKLVRGSSLGISAVVQNPLVLTKYDGLDPETDNGIDNNLYPRPRTYVFGLNANF